MSERIKERQSISMRDVLYVLFRHKWVILGVLAAVSALAVHSVRTAPKIYVSNANVVLNNRNGNSFSNAVVVYQINTDLQLLQSQGFAEAVIKRIGTDMILSPPPGRTTHVSLLQRAAHIIARVKPKAAATTGKHATNLSTFDDAVKVLQRNFAAANPPNTNLITLSYEAFSASDAQTLLKGILSTYLSKYGEIGGSTDSLQSLRQETQALQQELTDSTRALSAFQDKMGVVDFNEQQRLILQQIENLQTQVLETEASYSAAKAAILSAQGKLGMSQTAQQARVSAASLQAKLEALQAQLRNAQSKLKASGQMQAKLAELKSAVDGAAAQYKAYQSTLQQAQIERALSTGQPPNLSVSEAPTLPYAAKSGPLKKWLALVFASVVGVVAFAFLLERLNRSIRTPRDIAVSLKLVHLSSVPRVTVGAVRSRLRGEIRRRRRAGAAIPTTSLKLAEHAVTWLYFADEFRQAFEELRNRLEFEISDSSKRPFVLAITSCNRGEGVSSVAAGLAYSVAYAAGEGVLLVNSNSHHPQVDIVPGAFRPASLFELSVQHRMIPPSAGLPRLFDDRGMSDYVTDVGGSKAIGEILPSVQRLDYKLVILDLPSLREGGIAAIQASQADGTILVVESEHLVRESAEASIERLESADARLLGVVLNKRRYYVPNWLYRLS